MDPSKRFPKSARLLKKIDFKFFPFRQVQTPYFRIVYRTDGSGRLGISVSKKILKRAVARNRVRRLLKESFRTNNPAFAGLDFHVIALPTVFDVWRDLDLSQVSDILIGAAMQVRQKRAT